MAQAMLDGELMFPSEYLTAVEFRGKDVTLTISDVELADLRMKDNSTKRRPVLHFAEMQRRPVKKKLVLNKTNATAIAELLGNEARAWVGKRITLYPTTCQAFGKPADCIRIRPKVSPARNPAPPPQVDDDPLGGEINMDLITGDN